MNLTGRRPLGRSRNRWDANIRIDLKEIVMNSRDWIDSAQDRDFRRSFLKAD